MHNLSNQVSRIRLGPQLTCGVVEPVIPCDRFQVPTAAARLGVAWRVVNAKFDTGIPPPPARTMYEVVLVDA